jgi:hypothetical protein
MCEDRSQKREVSSCTVVNSTEFTQVDSKVLPRTGHEGPEGE